MTTEIRWGILGTGVIATKFATGLQVLAEAELAAVGSRSRASADQFGDQFNIPRRYASYQDLADDPNLDVVYVATPHSLHQENTLMCLEAGKAVLCEKPFAINAGQAEAMINLARRKGLFLMEAMWTRYVPAVVRLRQLLLEGVIGELRMLMADLGFRADFAPTDRLFDPHLGGGALLDVGIYPVSFAAMLFGQPSRITSLAHLGPTQVDEQAAILLGYNQGQLALLATAVRIDMPNQAILLGTQGQITVHSPIYCPTRLTLAQPGQADQLIDLPLVGNGYNYQAAEVMRCLRAGWLESATMPLAETLAIMQTMDEIRLQWGLRYPME